MKSSPPQELQSVLLQLFQAHGVEAQVDGDWITFPGRSGRILGLVFDLDHVHKNCSTQVDIRFSPWLGYEICESFSGLAETRQERIQQSLATFSQNTLYVLLKVFLNIDCCEHTNEIQVSNQGVVRTVTDGNVVFKGGDPANLSMAWVEPFQQLLATQPLNEGTHSIRLFYAQMNGKRMSLELLLDNEPWNSTMHAVSLISWPTGPEYFSLRQFTVVQGGLDVSRAIGLMTQHPGAKDEEWISILVDAGYALIDAKRLVILAPIAFGRQLLMGLGVVTPPQCQLPQGSIVDLRTSPIFQRSCEIAANAHGKASMKKEEFFSIASRDACVNAVNQALLAGSKPKDLKFASLRVFWEEAEPLCPLSIPQPLNPIREQVASKPWWKIW